MQQEPTQDETATSTELDSWRTFPLRIEQHDYGWTVTLHGKDGHALHVVNAVSEMEAFRDAHNLAHIYSVTGKAFVRSERGDYLVDVEKLMHRKR